MARRLILGGRCPGPGHTSSEANKKVLGWPSVVNFGRCGLGSGGITPEGILSFDVDSD
jgi:hypothetical protein